MDRAITLPLLCACLSMGKNITPAGSEPVHVTVRVSWNNGQGWKKWMIVGT